MKDLSLTAAGREIPDALDRIRRYCGLPWSGGEPETWGWHYYDAVPTPHDNHVTPVDVLCASALHPGLSRTDLAFFRERGDEVAQWLAGVPVETRFWELTDAELDHLASLPEALPGPSVSLLSKVLHRKRPRLIPLLDRHVIDWYRPLTGKRPAGEAWEPLVRVIAEEETSEHERRLRYAIATTKLAEQLRPDVDLDDRPVISWLRATDIAIWMGSR